MIGIDMKYKLTVPVAENNEILAKLRAGDSVLLSGTVYTARDQGHRRMLEILKSGDELPFDIMGSAIYYVGPTPGKEGPASGSAGPTTSGRMDAYSPALIDLGNRVMIGKGRRNEAVKNAIKRNGAVYLAAVGGAGALMSGCIRSSRIVAWEDLGCEALRRLEVEDMPLTVAIDSQGNDWYSIGPSEYLRSL